MDLLTFSKANVLELFMPKQPTKLSPNKVVNNDELLSACWTELQWWTK